MGNARVEVGRWDERPAGTQSEVVARLEALAWLMDASIPVPGTNLRIGLDPIIGLVPVVGDLIGMLFSAYILIEAARMGIPRVTLMRMGFNVALESAIGIVPILGDAFDFAWKANRKNVDLLQAHLRDPQRAKRGDWLFAGLFLSGTLGLCALLAWGGFALGRALIGLFAR